MSDLSAPQRLARFEADDDALGALSWRVNQVRSLLEEIDRAVRARDPRWQRQPSPPSWGDVTVVTAVLTRLCGVAVDLGLYRNTAEVGELVGVEVPPAGGPACGHSACRQNWIDSGAIDCIDGDAR